MVVVVNSQSLQTHGAFRDQRWMQRVQSWNDLREKILHKSCIFLFYPSFSLLVFSENISPDLSAARLQPCSIRDDREGRGSGREGVALLGDAHWRGGQRDGSCDRKIKTNGMQRYAEIEERLEEIFLTESHSAAVMVGVFTRREVHPWWRWRKKKKLTSTDVLI